MSIFFINAFIYMLFLTTFSFAEDEATSSEVFSKDNEEIESSIRSLQDSVKISQERGNQLKVSWEGKENSDQIYHLYGANKWQDLMPLSDPSAFIQNEKSKSTFLLSTNENTISLPRQPCIHLRLIAQDKDNFTDIARLITLQLPKSSFYEKSFKSASKTFSEHIKEKMYPLISEDVWKEVDPYLIPFNHTAKAVLDEIFANPKVLSSVEEFQKAGFEVLRLRSPKRMITARHPKLKKYLVKAYLDGQVNAEWTLWILRARGARFAKEIVDKRGLNEFIVVPEKWIYPVPRKASKKTHPFAKKFVLLVEDMHLMTEKQILYRWRFESSTDLLEALYLVLAETGYSDCHFNNVPFTMEGKIALVDFEYYKNWPVHFNKLTKHLAPFMQFYWEALIRKFPQRIESGSPVEAAPQNN